MSIIYFNDGGVYDSTTGEAEVTIYRVDPDQLQPTGSLRLQTKGPNYAQIAVSYDGNICAQSIDYASGSSQVVILNIEEGTQKSLAYNAAGNPTSSCAFSLDGKLFLACTDTLSILQPPYDTVQEIALPFEIDSFLLHPSGKKGLLFEAQTTGYIYDIESSSVGPAFNIIQDEAQAPILGTARMSPDSARFSIGCVYSNFQALAIFDAQTGTFEGRTGNIQSESAGYFLADGSAIVYKRSDTETLGIFDLATASETVISLSALDDDSQSSYGYNYTLRGLTDDGYAVMEQYGAVRRLSLSDGSVATTPMTKIDANGYTTVQPLGGTPGTVLRYFWTDFLKAYEEPAIVSG